MSSRPGVDPSDSSDRLHAALEGLVGESPDGMILYEVLEEGESTDFLRIYVNASAARILESSPSELVGRRVSGDHRGPSTPQVIFQFLVQALSAGTPVERMVESVGPGGPRFFLARARMMTDGILGVRIAEVTERELARRSAERRDRLLTGIAAAAERLLAGSWAEAVGDALALLASHAGAARAGVYRIHRGVAAHREGVGTRGGDGDGGRPARLSEVARWAIPGQSEHPPGRLGRCLKEKGALWEAWEGRLREGRMVLIEGERGPGPEGELLEALEAVRLLLLPIQVEEEWWGFMFFQDGLEAAPGRWSGGELEVLRSGATLLAAAVERERRLRELEEKDARLATAVAASRDGFLVLSRKGRILEWNEAAERILGAEDSGGPPPLNEVLPEAHELLSGGGFTGGWVEMDGRRDGEPGRFPVEITVTPMQVRGDDLFAVVIRDLTEQRQLEERLSQLERLETVGRLAGGVAHDFNNLLTVIEGNAELARYLLEEGAPPVNELEEIASAAERGGRLTQQLLAFSRRQVMRPVSLDLNLTVREMGNLIDSLIGDDVQVELELMEGLRPVVADESQMEQVLMNLVLNSRDAMPDGGLLRIRTAEVEVGEGEDRTGEFPTGRYVRLSVEDTGEGMSPEIRQRAFEPFFTTKEQGKGTGLGLATVYGVVKQSLGEIRVESREGVGTTIHVDLPVHSEGVAAESSAGARPISTDGVSADRLQVLVADPDERMRRNVRSLLEARGFAVAEAPSGRMAEELLAGFGMTVDLMLTEVLLPEMTGGVLVERARRSHPGIRVLFLAGGDPGSLVQQRLLPPGAPVLRKPFSSGEVMEAVRGVLGGAPKPP